MTDGDPIQKLAELMGHRLAEDNRRLYEDGLRKTALALGISEKEAAERALAFDRVAYREVISGITVGETYFFRHPEHFELAARHAEKAATSGRPVRTAWSAGCASGEEAYSLASALSQYSPSLRVFGSDISVEALEVARLGRYGSWSFRNRRPESIPELERVGGQWEVSPKLKAMVTFNEVNMAQDPVQLPPGLTSVDVIFCRNMLLYFQPAQSARILAALAGALSEGGLLILGALEAPSIPPQGLQPVPDSNGSALVKPLKQRIPLVRPPAPPRRYSTAERMQLPSADVLAMAKRLADTGDLEGSLRMAESLPLSEEALSLAATVCFERGDLEKARKHLEKLLAMAPNDGSAHLRLALVALRSDDRELLDKSQRALDRLVAGRRDDEEVGRDGMKVAYVRQVLADLRGAR